MLRISRYMEPKQETKTTLPLLHIM